jgi:hypothetical protein
MFCNRSGGACFFFDIDVKGGEKSSGGESECTLHVGACVPGEESECILHVGVCVAINAKGGDCWQIFNR